MLQKIKILIQRNFSVCILVSAQSYKDFWGSLLTTPMLMLSLSVWCD